MRRAAPLVTAILLALPARADDALIKVIAPGNEPLVAEMLGGKDTLAGGCVLDGASIERTRVVAHYVCAGKPLALALHHPSDPAAASAAARTKQFAVVTTEAALAADVASRAATREGAFRWVSAEPPGRQGGLASDKGNTPRANGAPAALAGPPPPHHLFTTPSTFAAAAAAIAAIAGAAWLLSLRRARAARS